MEITAKMVADLREITGVGMMDCKKALTEAGGDMDKAIKILSEQGKAKVAKKAGRIAAEGIIGVYSHMGGKLVGMCEINCETDFAAKNPKLVEFAKDMAMQAVASSPLVVSREQLSAEYIEEQKALFKAQLMNDPKFANKPQNILDNIIEGKLNKHYEEVCLIDQPFIKDPDKKVQELLNDLTLLIGEKITIRRLVRWEVGEGLEKRVDDFAAEVAAQSNS
ncbi:MAG: translation elongation factor Ts [Clostridia bacterium]|nr:translation elongation factor Ts [Clostridia bacterium]